MNFPLYFPFFLFKIFWKLNAFLSLLRWSSPQLERHQPGVSVTAHWPDPETRGLSRHCCNEWQAQTPVPRQRQQDVIRQVMYNSVGPIMKWFNACCSFTIVWPIHSLVVWTVSSGTEDLFSPRAASVFPRSVAGTPQTPQAPVTVPFTPDLNSPFALPAMRRLTATAEQYSPTFSTVQSPHVLRRGPKLWSTSTGELC